MVYTVHPGTLQPVGAPADTGIGPGVELAMGICGTSFSTIGGGVCLDAWGDVYGAVVRVWQLVVQSARSGASGEVLWSLHTWWESSVSFPHVCALSKTCGGGL